MKSPQLLASLALLVSVATTANAQENPAPKADALIEPPQMMAAEQPETAQPSTVALTLASQEVARAIGRSPDSVQPSPPLEDAPLEVATIEPAPAPPAPEEVADADVTAPEEVEALPSADELLDGKKDERTVPEKGSFAEITSEDLRTTLQVLRRLQRKVDDGIGKVNNFAAKIADPLAGQTLVLTPYVDNPAWGAVVADLYDDKCKSAQGKMKDLTGEPNEKSEPALRYMWARIQMCSGEANEGRKTLSELAKGDGPIAIISARRLGEKVTVKVDDDGEEGMYLSGRIRAAKKTAKKDLDKGLAELDELRKEMTSRWDRFKVDRAKAQALEDAKRYDDASEAFLKLYRRSRNWKVNASIEDEIEALERKTGKDILTYGERIDRMRSLVARGRYSEAKKVSIQNAKIRKVGGSEIRGWTYYRQALQAEREKKRTKAIELFEKANKLVKDDEVRPRLYFGWARALRRTDRDSDAVALYEKLCAEYANNVLCDEATYEAGRLLQFQNKHDKAIAKFDAVIDKHDDSDHVPDALWRKAFSHYLLKQYDAMDAPLKRLQAEFGTEQDASELSLGLKSAYWLAMAAYRRGDMPLAERRFQATINAGPLTWYGRLAATRMEEAGWMPSVNLPSERLSADDLRNVATLRIPRNARLEVGAELARLGLWDDALKEVKTQSNIHPVPDGAERMLGAIYLAKDRPDWAHWVMKKQIAESGPTWSTLRDWGTAFPLNFMELSHEHGTKAGVSPFLVQAIIRQESGFRPAVSSWAGAVGLMQLMPGTAAYTARVFKEERTKFRRNDLKDSERNVSLGAKYIRLHTAHAKDSIPLALAGYNAGPRPLESWIDRYSDRELDAWVESITYREARGYVRKVYTSYVTYSALYGGELPDLKLDVPGKLPEWGDVPEIARTNAGQPVSMR